MSIPCIFPPRWMADGRPYADGCLRAGVPMMVDPKSCEKVYVIIPSDRPHDYQGNDNMFTAAIRAMNIIGNDEKLDLVKQLESEPNVVVLWPDTPSQKGMMHVDHSLIRKSYDWTINELHKKKG